MKSTTHSLSKWSKYGLTFQSLESTLLSEAKGKGKGSVFPISSPPLIYANDEDRPTLAKLLAAPLILRNVLTHLDFISFRPLRSVSWGVRRAVNEGDGKEEVLERWLSTETGYQRWSWEGEDPLVIRVVDLESYRQYCLPLPQTSLCTSLTL